MRLKGRIEHTMINYIIRGLNRVEHNWVDMYINSARDPYYLMKFRVEGLCKKDKRERTAEEKGKEKWSIIWIGLGKV